MCHARACPCPSASLRHTHLPFLQSFPLHSSPFSFPIHRLGMLLTHFVITHFTWYCHFARAHLSSAAHTHHYHHYRSHASTLFSFRYSEPRRLFLVPPLHFHSLSLSVPTPTQLHISNSSLCFFRVIFSLFPSPPVEIGRDGDASLIHILCVSY
ncbi:hypothetical protein DL93DRAFT_1333008 [Clavulina sp. PMI_390]|nr:hypothetical protein DL93DRAFT_1333008 [Clavulina sp. PMI_390]